MAKQSVIPENLRDKDGVKVKDFFRGLPEDKLTAEAIEKEYTIRLNGFQLGLIKKATLGLIRNSPELQAYESIDEVYKLRQILESAMPIVS